MGTVVNRRLGSALFDSVTIADTAGGAAFATGRPFLVALDVSDSVEARSQRGYGCTLAIWPPNSSNTKGKVGDAWQDEL